MSESKKMLICGIVIVALIALIPLTYLFGTGKSKKELNKFENYIDSSELKFLYLGREDCGYCVAFQPELKFISEQYDVDYLYVDTNNLSNNDLLSLLETLEIDPDDFGTPYLVITKDGKPVIKQSGFLTDNQLFEFLQANGLIDESEKLVFNYIDYTQYGKVITANTNQLVLVGQIQQDSSKDASKSLVDIAKEYNLTINYLNGSLMEEDEIEALSNTYAEFDSSTEISTPLFMIIKNGKIVDALIGETSKQKYIDFLQENKIIKE